MADPRGFLTTPQQHPERLLPGDGPGRKPLEHRARAQQPLAEDQRHEATRHAEQRIREQLRGVRQAVLRDVEQRFVAERIASVTPCTLSVMK